MAKLARSTKQLRACVDWSSPCQANLDTLNRSRVGFPVQKNSPIEVLVCQVLISFKAIGRCQNVNRIVLLCKDRHMSKTDIVITGISLPGHPWPCIALAFPGHLTWGEGGTALAWCFTPVPTIYTILLAFQSCSGSGPSK